jgi:hypothetical protein
VTVEEDSKKEGKVKGRRGGVRMQEANKTRRERNRKNGN